MEEFRISDKQENNNPVGVSLCLVEDVNVPGRYYKVPVEDLNKGYLNGIPIDDTNKADGYVLAYNETENKFEYVVNAGGGGGGGDVTGPGSSGDENIPLFNGTTGKIIKDSGLKISDIGGGNLSDTDIDTLAKLNAIVTDATLIDTNDSRLSDARTPTPHTHVASDITDFDTEVSNNPSVSANTAKVGITTQQANDITANNAKISATGNELESTDIDTLAKLNTVVTDATLINTTDPRLSDARTPTAHTHTESEITDLDKYSQSEVDSLLSGKANIVHTHVASDITDFNTEVSNNSSVSANTAKNSYPSSDATKVGFISVTQSVDLDTIESDVANNNAKNSYPSADATKLSNIEANAEVQDLTIRTQETTNFTTASTISNSYTECNNATSLQVTITDAACAIGKILAFNQFGAGTVTYVGDGGVTLVDNGVSGLASTNQGGTDIFLKVAANKYQMI